MKIYNYEEGFGAHDRTSRAMRGAIESWFALYFQQTATQTQDPCQRIAYVIVNKLVRTIFGEYQTTASDPFIQRLLQTLNRHRKRAVQLALVGGECYLKPCPEKEGFSFTVVPRNSVLIFGRNADGEPTDIGTVEQTVSGKFYFTLLERRRVDPRGYLTIENRLFRSPTPERLGTQVPLSANPLYGELKPEFTIAVPVESVGLVRMKTPMINCVDGSADGISIYAAAVGLIRNIDRNEAQMNGEFERGESRIITSADLLDGDALGNRGLNDHLFVGLDDEVDRVGLTVFSPALREQSFLARKQEYLRNVESLVGLKRGMLSDASAEERTATEVASSAGDYNLTVIDLQQMWEDALRQTAELCLRLAAAYLPNTAVPKAADIFVDWGNGILYDEDKIWEDYRQMVASGMLRPEVALGWRFNMPADTAQARRRIREKYMPELTQ